MLTIKVAVPDPSRYVTYDVIDTVALQYNTCYREASGSKTGQRVDVNELIALLGIPLVWEDIEEPDDTMFLAKLSSDPQERITVNRRHADLFDERPDVYCSAIGHEIGHKVLRHIEHPELRPAEATLFSDTMRTQQYLHKSSWGQFGMTKDEVIKRQALVKEIAKQAGVSELARKVIAQLNYFHEPEWMFWQAEHFSRCLLIPKDRLFEELENPWGLGRWSGIYQLAQQFGVSGSMMKNRLVKLKIVEIGKDGNPHVVQGPKQGSLFS